MHIIFYRLNISRSCLTTMLRKTKLAFHYFFSLLWASYIWKLIDIINITFGIRKFDLGKLDTSKMFQILVYGSGVFTCLNYVTYQFSTSQKLRFKININNCHHIYETMTSQLCWPWLHIEKVSFVNFGSDSNYMSQPSRKEMITPGAY